MLLELIARPPIPGTEGDWQALGALVPQLYGQLHRLASARLRGERADHTLQTTALVNETYLRLAEAERLECQSPSHFLFIAARMMRRVLVDHGRGRRRLKRGAGSRRVPLEQVAPLSLREPPDLVALDESLSRLTESDPELGQVVELLFFGGFTQGEVAVALGVSESTVNRRWRMARAWLLRCLD